MEKKKKKFKIYVYYICILEGIHSLIIFYFLLLEKTQTRIKNNVSNLSFNSLNFNFLKGILKYNLNFISRK